MRARSTLCQPAPHAYDASNAVLALNANAVQKQQRKLTFVVMTGVQYDIQWDTTSFCRQMDFSATAAHLSARILLPSSAVADQSS